jgi:peptide/nickel transport system substrate-binding protein
MLNRRNLTRATAAVVLTAAAHPTRAAPPDEIIVAQAADAYTMDPGRHSVFPTANVLFQIYDALVTVDNQGGFKPALALTWSNPDPLTWRFRLRQGVRFHNGEPMNAAAVKATFDRVLDPAFKAPYYSRISAIRSVSVVDDYTVELHTAKPYPTMLFALTEASFPALIVPPGYLAQKGPDALGTAPVGTGPYRFVEWRKDDRVVLEANPDYWGGKPAIARAVFRPIKETRTRIAELRSGGVQLAVDIPPEDIPGLSGGATRIANIASDFLYFFAFDTLKPSPLTDKRVRQAINHAVDVAAIQKALLGGLGSRIALTLPTNALGYDPSWTPYPYDTARAKALLAEAGYPDGFTIPMIGRQGRYLKDREIMDATAGFLRRVGIKIVPRYLEAGVWEQVSEQKGREGIAFPGWSGRDPDLVWFPLLRTGQYQSYYSNPALDALLDAGRATLDKAQRLAIYQQAAAIIKDDAPHLPLIQPPLIYGVSAKLDWMPRTDGMIDLRKARYS